MFSRILYEKIWNQKRRCNLGAWRRGRHSLLRCNTSEIETEKRNSVLSGVHHDAVFIHVFSRLNNYSGLLLNMNGTWTKYFLRVKTRSGMVINTRPSRHWSARPHRRGQIWKRLPLGLKHNTLLKEHILPTPARAVTNWAARRQAAAGSLLSKTHSPKLLTLFSYMRRRKTFEVTKRSPSASQFQIFRESVKGPLP